MRTFIPLKKLFIGLTSSSLELCQLSTWQPWLYMHEKLVHLVEIKNWRTKKVPKPRVRETFSSETLSKIWWTSQVSSCWDKHLIKICKELIFLFKSPYNLIFHNLKMSFLEGRNPPRVMHNKRRGGKRKTKWHTLKVSLFIFVRSLQRNNRRELQSCRLGESSRDTSRTLFPVFPRPVFQTSCCTVHQLLHEIMQCICVRVCSMYENPHIFAKENLSFHITLSFWIVFRLLHLQIRSFLAEKEKQAFFSAQVATRIILEE